MKIIICGDVSIKDDCKALLIPARVRRFLMM